MPSLRLAILPLLLPTCGCSSSPNGELPVRFTFKSERYYQDIANCDGIRSLIKQLKLGAVSSNREVSSGRTFIKSDGSAKLSLSLQYHGTLVIYRAATAPSDATVAAALACAS